MRIIQKLIEGEEPVSSVILQALLESKESPQERREREEREARAENSALIKYEGRAHLVVRIQAVTPDRWQGVLTYGPEKKEGWFVYGTFQLPGMDRPLTVPVGIQPTYREFNPPKRIEISTQEYEIGLNYVGDSSPPPSGTGGRNAKEMGLPLKQVSVWGAKP